MKDAVESGRIPLSRVTESRFGTTLGGCDIYRYRIDGGDGSEVSLMNYGGALVSIRIPDLCGQPRDVCLKYDSFETYEEQSAYMGAILGRFANRIANARFSLNQREYRLTRNDGAHHIHGGVGGFHRCVWGARVLEDGVEFSRQSPDGDQGYPGNLDVSVTYRFSLGRLSVTYCAVSDQDTYVNLSNHCYFNLAGGGDVLDHYLVINADRFLENDEEFIPTGRFLPVDGTPMDFRAPRRIGDGVDSDHEQLVKCDGYDHDFLLSDSGMDNPAAVLYCEESGIRMKVYTTMPGIELYTGNQLAGTPHRNRAGLCLETQYFPNSPNCAVFPSALLLAGEPYWQQTVYQFDVCPKEDLWPA